MRPQTWCFLKKDTPTQVFSRKYCKIFKTMILNRTSTGNSFWKTNGSISFLGYCKEGICRICIWCKAFRQVWHRYSRRLFYKKARFLKYRNIHRKKPVFESHFWKIVELRPTILTQMFPCEYWKIFKST